MKIAQHNQDKDGRDATIFKENPWEGYLKKFEVSKKKLNPVHEIVDLFFRIRGMDKMPKNFYRGRYAYPKIAKEAKDLLEMCGGDLEDALWAVDKMHYLAKRGHFDWTIRTCLKHNLI